ncbi:hypothetical protein NE236_41640 [Actinoallomurus purpureus]|nr:hypothetical protein [Actinoallomurus purpureus]
MPDAPRTALDDDVAAARQALDAVAAGEPVIPWEDVKARLDDADTASA